MSPEPRKKPAACENVGAAETAVAANAPISALRVMPDEFDAAILLRRPVCCLPVMLHRPFSSHPQMHLSYCIEATFNQVLNSGTEKSTVF